MKCFDDATTDAANATATHNIGNMNRAIQHPSASINMQHTYSQIHSNTFPQQKIY